MSEAVDLRYLIDNQHFIACRLLSTSRFVKYCKDRGIWVSKEQLERFEELGLFHPVARTIKPREENEHPHVWAKVKYTDGNRTYVGRLEEGEAWDGEVERLLTGFDFGKPYVYEWLERGLLWDPLSLPFRSWGSYKNEGRMESYYSVFQCYHLHNLIKQTTLVGRAEIRISYGEEEIQQQAKDTVKRAQEMISRCREGVKGENAVIICQAISNRYFPQTQTDQRTIRISGFGGGPEPDWHEYRRGWDAETVLSELGSSTDELKRLQEKIAFDANMIDPLEKWYGLVSFVSVEQKKRLKGDALFAQSLYSMEHMLRLFFEDLTGERLPAPDESPMWTPGRLYGEGVPENELDYLELLTNHYSLNPRPKLILVVEGAGELEQFPRLIEEFFGYSLQRAGIDIQRLEGIGEFTSRRLERFIDDHHDKQTYVFIVLDNEGNASAKKDSLIKQRSRYFPKRAITSSDLVYLWDRSVEFDNFTHAEIAQAMTEVGKGLYIFTPEQIAKCESSFGRGKGDPLSRLFEEKTEYGLNKRELLRVLFDMIISNAEAEMGDDGGGKRPVTRMLLEVVELAATNYQPVTSDIRRINQESGYLGDVLE